ncbi:checkpoint protein HUS1B-like [Oppia nitens]|uniref:checkpoint protein HUS1B-like n=1 Tax=Oppia nitens TaxID=1686743 RepID=UPI0023DAF77A|nr:checkpoint protein HUS1B-like [Oppia nitens]
MKFRGVITDSSQISAMVRVLQSMSKFWDTFFVRLTDQQMQMIADRTNSLAPFVVKCDLNVTEYFDEYEFNGFNDENNVIVFEMRSQCVSQVMTSLLANIKSMKLKLIMKSGLKMLVIAVEYPTHDADRSVRHDIRVDIPPLQYWDQIYGLNVDTYDLSIKLPETRAIISTIERLNEMCSYLTIKVKPTENNKAVLTIGVESDSIALKTTFTDLEINSSDDNEEIDGRHWVSIRISVKKFNIIFNTLKTLKPNFITCNVKDKNKIYFQFFHNFANFQAILPNIEA